MSATVIFYSHRVSDKECPRPLWEAAALSAAFGTHGANGEGMEPFELLAVVSRKDNYLAQLGYKQTVFAAERGQRDCWGKIATGLALAKFATVFIVEHDVMYCREHFHAAPVPKPGECWYDRSIWRHTREGYHGPGAILTSMATGHRDCMLASARARLAALDKGQRIVWDEFGRDTIDAKMVAMRYWYSGAPCLDVRWGGNLTGDRKAAEYASALAPWGEHAKQWARYGI